MKHDEKKWKSRRHSLHARDASPLPIKCIPTLSAYQLLSYLHIIISFRASLHFLIGHAFWSKKSNITVEFNELQ